MALETSELAAVKQMMASQHLLSRSSRGLEDRSLFGESEINLTVKPEFETFFATFNFKRDPVFGPGGIYPNKMPNSVDLYLKAAAESLSKVEICDPEESTVLHKIINFLANLAVSEQEEREYYLNAVKKLEHILEEKTDLLAAGESDISQKIAEIGVLNDKIVEMNVEFNDLNMKLYEYEKAKGDEFVTIEGLKDKNYTLLQEIEVLKGENQQHVRNSNMEFQKMLQMRTAFEELQKENIGQESLISQTEVANNNLNEDNKRLNGELSLLRAKYEETVLALAEEGELSTLERDLSEQQLREVNAQILQQADEIEELEAELMECKTLMKAKLNKSNLSREPSRLTEDELMRAQGSLANLGREVVGRENIRAERSELELVDEMNRNYAIGQWVNEQQQENVESSKPSIATVDSTSQIEVPPTNSIANELKGAVSHQDSTTTLGYEDQVLNPSDSDPAVFLQVPALDKLSIDGALAITKSNDISRSVKQSFIPSLGKTSYQAKVSAERTYPSDEEAIEEVEHITGSPLGLRREARRIIVKDDKEVQTIFTMAYIGQLYDDVRGYKKENDQLREKISKLNRKLEEEVREHYKLKDDEEDKGKVSIEFDAKDETVNTVVTDLKEAEREASTNPNPSAQTKERISHKKGALLEAKLEQQAIKTMFNQTERRTLFVPEKGSQVEEEDIAVPLMKQQESQVNGTSAADNTMREPKRYNLAENAQFKDEYGINTRVESNAENASTLQEKSDYSRMKTVPDNAEENRQLATKNTKGDNNIIPAALPASAALQRNISPIAALTVKEAAVAGSEESFQPIEQKKSKFGATLPKTTDEVIKMARSERIMQQYVARGNARHMEFDLKIQEPSASERTIGSLYPEKCGLGFSIRHENPLKRVVEQYEKKKEVATNKVAEFLRNVQLESIALEGGVLPQEDIETEVDKVFDNEADMEDSGAFATADAQFFASCYRSPQEAVRLLKDRIQRKLEERELQVNNVLQITQPPAEPLNEKTLMSSHKANELDEREPQNGCYTFEKINARCHSPDREIASLSLREIFGGHTESNRAKPFETVELTDELYKSAFRHIQLVFSLKLEISLLDYLDESLIDEIDAEYYPVVNDNSEECIFIQGEAITSEEAFQPDKCIDFLRVLPEFRKITDKLKTITEVDNEWSSYLVCNKMVLKSEQWTEEFCNGMYAVVLTYISAKIHSILAHPEIEIDISGIITSYLNLQYGLPFLIDEAILFLVASCYFYKSRNPCIELFYLLMTGELSNTHLIFLEQVEEQLEEYMESSRIVHFFSVRFHYLRDLTADKLKTPHRLNKAQERLAMLILFSLGHVIGSSRILELYMAMRSADSRIRRQILYELGPHVEFSDLGECSFASFMEVISFAPKYSTQKLSPSALLSCAEVTVLTILELIQQGTMPDIDKQDLLERCHDVEEIIERRNCMHSYLCALVLLERYEELVLEDHKRGANASE